MLKALALIFLALPAYVGNLGAAGVGYNSNRERFEWRR